MPVIRILTATVFSGCLLFQTSQSEAGCLGRVAKWIGMAIATSVIDAWGKDFYNKAQQIVIDYFDSKVKREGNNKKVIIKDDDIEELEERFDENGLTKCDLNNALDTVTYESRRSAPDKPKEPSGYSATAHCSITGVTGESDDQETSEDALAMAIEDCINQGGAPRCCKRGAELVP